MPCNFFTYPFPEISLLTAHTYLTDKTMGNPADFSLADPSQSTNDLQRQRETALLECKIILSNVHSALTWLKNRVCTLSIADEKLELVEVCRDCQKVADMFSKLRNTWKVEETKVKSKTCDDYEPLPLKEFQEMWCMCTTVTFAVKNLQSESIEA